mgnify:CR=1 FL=1
MTEFTLEEVAQHADVALGEILEYKAQVNTRATTRQVALQHCFVTALKRNTIVVQPAGMRDTVEAELASLRTAMNASFARTDRSQAVLDARKQALEEEKEKLRAIRASIADDNDQQQAAEPRRQKTLAELEAAQASFGKQSQPVMSLYAQ